LGAAVGPAELIKYFTQLTTNDEACTTNFIQWAGVAALTDPEVTEWRRQMVETLRSRRDLV
jgi:aspartate/methionine/tyrosine aminotransferase